MSSVSPRSDRNLWRVQWITLTGRKSRTFKSEADARAFVPADERPHCKSGAKWRRSADQVKSLIGANVRRSGGCHIWTGSLTNVGYPRLTWLCDEGYKIRGGHRLAYHLWVAPVPDDRFMSVDHLCRNRACVNPAHLELVTQRENVMRSPVALGALNAAKTHCPQGHPYSPENTYTYSLKSPRQSTVRACKTCRAAYRRRRYQALKAVSA